MRNRLGRATALLFLVTILTFPFLRVKFVEMPGNKHWHLEVRASAILLIHDDKEARHKNGQPLGPIKDLFYGCEHGQAKTFKAHAIEVRISPVYIHLMLVATA